MWRRRFSAGLWLLVTGIAIGVFGAVEPALADITLTVTKAGTGSGTVASGPAGIDCGATCSASFPFGTTVALGASPALGSTFGGWSGGGGTGPCTVTLTTATTLTAGFNPAPPVTLTVTKTPSTVSPSRSAYTSSVSSHWSVWETK